MEADPLRPLLAAAREGDDVALAELVRRTQGPVLRLCGILGAPADPDDLAQETYLRVLRGLDAYRGDAPVRAWLLAIARRVCADAVRERRRRTRLAERIAREPVAIESAVGAPVADLLAGLDAERREAFVLTQLVGLSYAEAAHVLACPVGTIRSRVARARRDLAGVVGTDRAARITR
jgi:RNA polymerase sigma-70 factor (ECF subfamily)